MFTCEDEVYWILFKTVHNISEKELRNFQLAIYNLYPNGNSRSIGPEGNKRTCNNINKIKLIMFQEIIKFKIIIIIYFYILTKKIKKQNLKRADQSLPKNTIRLADFETRIKSLEEKTGIVDSTISEDSEKMKELKNSMLENKNEILQKLTESNEEITTKIKEQFKNDLDCSEKLYSQNLEDIE